MTTMTPPPGPLPEKRDRLGWVPVPIHAAPEIVSAMWCVNTDMSRDRLERMYEAALDAARRLP